MHGRMDIILPERLPAKMYCIDPGQPPGLPAVLLHPVTEVSILDIEKISLIEQSGIFEGFAPQEHQGSLDEIHLLGLRCIKIEIQIPARPGIVRQQTPQEGSPAKQDIAVIWKTTAGMLRIALWADDLTTRNTTSRIVFHETGHTLDRPGQYDHIRIDEKNVPGTDFPDHPVCRLCEASIGLSFDEMHVWKCLPGCDQTLIGRTIVINMNITSVGRSVVSGKRAQTIFQMSAGIVIDDNDRYVHCLPSTDNNRNFHTSQKASQMMRRDILDIPSVRSTKMMGISFIDSPARCTQKTLCIWKP